MIPPSYLFPVDRLRNGPDVPDGNVRRGGSLLSVWPALLAGGLAGGAVAYMVGVLAA